MSLLINIVFNVFYSYAGAFQDDPHVPGWVVLASRALIGFGAGEYMCTVCDGSQKIQEFKD